MEAAILDAATVQHIRKAAKWTLSCKCFVRFY